MFYCLWHIFLNFIPVVNTKQWKNLLSQRNLFTLSISWKSSWCWLHLVIHFGFENWAEQLKTTVCFTKSWAALVLVALNIAPVWGSCDNFVLSICLTRLLPYKLLWLTLVSKTVVSKESEIVYPSAIRFPYIAIFIFCQRILFDRGIYQVDLEVIPPLMLYISLKWTPGITWDHSVMSGTITISLSMAALSL